MKKPIFATLGVVVAALAVANDLTHAQQLQSGPPAATTAITPAVSPAAASAAAAQPTFVPVGSTGGGVSQQGMGQAIGLGAPVIGSGLGIGGGAPMGGGIPIGSGLPINGGAPIGAGTPIGNGAQAMAAGTPMGAGQPVANSLPIAMGNTTAGGRSLQLQGTITQSGSAFQPVGNLAANPNMQIVRNQAGQFFFQAPNGQLQTIPAGTNIAGLMGQSNMGLTMLQRAALFNGTAAPFMTTPMTLMRTTSDGSVATASAQRGVFTNGFPTAVAGNIITEYPQKEVQTFARVYPKTAPAKKAVRKHSRKSSGVYLK